MASSDKLVVTQEDGIKRITFNRPERLNAVDPETMELLRKAIAASASDDSKVIILTGTGEAFCAGADLQGSGSEGIWNLDVTASLRSETNPAIQGMRSLPKPIIARVHGAAAGIGFSYALACDMILASDQAKFGQLFVKIGLMPDGGSTYFLPRLVGYAKAFELMATGEVIGAQQALALGLINRVVAFAELDSVVSDLAVRLAAAPSIALAKMKEGLNLGLRTDLGSALEFEAVNQAVCFRSDDFSEGLRAFLEKRKPQFKGK